MRQNETNQDLRKEITKRGLFYWQVAARIGVADTTFSRMLRSELSPEQKARILKMIDAEGAADGTEKTQMDSTPI